jgi:hypothetical protein
MNYYEFHKTGNALTWNNRYFYYRLVPRFYTKPLGKKAISAIGSTAMAGGGGARGRPNPGRGSRRRRGEKRGKARGGPALPEGSLGETRGGRSCAAHGRSSRRPVAHGGGGAPACGGENGRAGKVRWGTEELMVRSVWEGKERRGKLHYGPSSRRR